VEDTGLKLPTVKVAQRYGVTTRSIERWEEDQELRFPRPLVINRRKYWALVDLETWERRRAAAA
jgi:hypothetical protein